MSTQKYRATGNGAWMPTPEGPARTVTAGAILALTEEQAIANAALFEPVDAPKAEAPAPVEHKSPTRGLRRK